MNPKSIKEIASQISLILPRWLRGMRVVFFSSPTISTSQLAVLLSINEKGKVKAGRLSKEMGVSAPTITGIVDRLVRNGYLKRYHDTADRRAINIQLTKKGQAETRRFLKAVRNRWKNILIHLHPQERQLLLKILNRVLSIVEQKNE